MRTLWLMLCHAKWKDNCWPSHSPCRDGWSPFNLRYSKTWTCSSWYAKFKTMRLWGPGVTILVCYISRIESTSSLLPHWHKPSLLNFTTTLMKGTTRVCNVLNVCFIGREWNSSLRNSLNNVMFAKDISLKIPSQPASYNRSRCHLKFGLTYPWILLMGCRSLIVRPQFLW